MSAPADASGAGAQGEPIANEQQAGLLVSRLMTAPAIALDTEGDGMFRYRTRLCTVQLGGAGEIAVLDTLALPAAPLLCELLGPRGPEKIVHDVSFDARVLFAHGVEVGRVFDTSIAARFLGIAATGLSSLLLKFFGVHLPKHRQQADWGLRPIDAEAMRYLEDDVRYLEQLAACLLGELRAHDIEAEVREECAYVLSEARQGERAPEAAWMRIKGAGLRLPKERARLFEHGHETLGNHPSTLPRRAAGSPLAIEPSRPRRARPDHRWWPARAAGSCMSRKAPSSGCSTTPSSSRSAGRCGAATRSCSTPTGWSRPARATSGSVSTSCRGRASACSRRASRRAPAS